ncbi:hypothetical protein EDB80DRAFT_596401, partial [Ilyonectria destructans]
RLGNIDAARLLLEQSYTGYENLQKPNTQATIVTLNNLAATYKSLRKTYYARALLESAIPRMRHSFGPGDETTYCAVRNLLQFTQGNVVAAEVWDAICDI